MDSGDKSVSPGDAVVASYTHGPGIDDPLVMRLHGGGGAADFFYHKNHQGSITEITDGSGNVAKQYKYDAYGRKYFETGLPVTDEFAYTARQIHDRTGLYYYRNRFYYPQIGRFISQDPIGMLGGTSLYAYVGNNPVNWVDPLGLCESKGWWSDPFLFGLPNPYLFDFVYGLPPIAPPGVNIADNIAQAEARMNPFWFYNQVKPTGPWNYKLINPVYERFGNFNYGATGAAFGFPELILLRGAGAVQENPLDEWGGPLGGAPYGDDPVDQFYIKRGIIYYNVNYQ